MSYTEWDVAAEINSSDLNGGGLNAGADGTPLVTKANCDSDVGGTQITNADANGWGAAAVGDPICFDIAGAKDPSVITNVAGDVLTVSPAVTGSLAGKTVRVGGPWATVDHACSTVTTVMLGASGNAPCINLRYDASDYSEQVQFDHTGTTAVPITLEGYESAPHDGCPGGNRPTISSAAGALAGVLYAAAGVDYLRVRHVDVAASGAGIEGISMTTDYSHFAHMGIAAAGAGADGLQNTNGYHNYYTDLKVSGAAYGGRFGYYGTIDRVVGQDAATACLEGKAGNTWTSCVAHGTGTTTYGFLLNSGASTMQGCAAYDCATGVYLPSISCTVRYSIFESNSTAGIRSVAARKFSHRCDHNFFYGNAADYSATTVVNYGGDNDVTLTASPFADAASGDFRLNGVAGGGALVRSLALPHVDGINTDYLDGGAFRAPDSMTRVGSGGLVG